MDKDPLEARFATTLAQLLNALNSVKGIQEGLIAEYPELFSEEMWLSDCVTIMETVADALREQARTDAWNGTGPDLQKKRRVVSAWLDHLRREFADESERKVFTIKQACNILVRRAMEYAATLAKLAAQLIAEAAQTSGANA